MFDKWLKLPAHYYLHLTALSLLVVGIALSNVLMSIGTIWIIANWLIELNFKEKLNRFKQNKTVIAIVLMFVLMVLSLSWSSNISYGLKDILVKLPFITIPLVLGTTKPLKPKEQQFLTYLFFLSLSFTTIFNFIRYTTGNYGDIREMSFFISHIRLGGLLCLAIFLGSYGLIKHKIKMWFSIPILIWLLFYLIKSETLSAYVLFVLLAIATTLFSVNKAKKLIFGSVLILGLGAIVFYAISVISTVNVNQSQKIDTKNLVWYTVNSHYVERNGIRCQI